MEKNVRRSPYVIDIKWFYKESSSSEEERKKDQEGHQKNCISTKGTVSLGSFDLVYCEEPNLLILCELSLRDELFHLIWAWSVVSFWQRIRVDSFAF